jgi:hypothetical protein
VFRVTAADKKSDNMFRVTAKSDNLFRVTSQRDTRHALSQPTTATILESDEDLSSSDTSSATSDESEEDNASSSRGWENETIDGRPLRKGSSVGSLVVPSATEGAEEELPPPFNAAVYVRTASSDDEGAAMAVVKAATNEEEQKTEDEDEELVLGEVATRLVLVEEDTGGRGHVHLMTDKWDKGRVSPFRTKRRRVRPASAPPSAQPRVAPSSAASTASVADAIEEEAGRKAARLFDRIQHLRSIEARDGLQGTARTTTTTLRDLRVQLWLHVPLCRGGRQQRARAAAGPAQGA